MCEGRREAALASSGTRRLAGVRMRGTTFRPEPQSRPARSGPLTRSLSSSLGGAAPHTPAPEERAHGRVVDARDTSQRRSAHPSVLGYSSCGGGAPTPPPGSPAGRRPARDRPAPFGGCGQPPATGALLPRRPLPAALAPAARRAAPRRPARASGTRSPRSLVEPTGSQRQESGRRAEGVMAKQCQRCGPGVPDPGTASCSSVATASQPSSGRPLSSSTSRATAASGVSPASMAPPGTSSPASG